MSELFKWLNKSETVHPGILDTERDKFPHIFHSKSDPVAQFRKTSIQESPKKSNSNIPITDQTEFDLELADMPIRTVWDARSLAGEQFRFFRTRLNQMQRQHGFKKLLITSSVPKEGKTFIACALAGILAQEQGKLILLIDADLRKPATSKTLGIKTRRPYGLAQILENKGKWTDFLLHSPDMGLSYLPAGTIPTNPSELLASERLDLMLHEMQEQFDWIILDSPPVLTIADSSQLASRCDTVLFVVRANKTPAKTIQKATHTIGKNLLGGIILNRMQNRRTSHYYYYRYYSESGERIK
jgi:protein-tyrosine kinase